MADMTGLSKHSPKLLRQPVTFGESDNFTKTCGIFLLLSAFRSCNGSSVFTFNFVGSSPLVYSFSSFSWFSSSAKKQSKINAASFQSRSIINTGITAANASSKTVSQRSDTVTTTKSMTIQNFVKKSQPKAIRCSICSAKNVQSTPTQILCVSLASLSPVTSYLGFKRLVFSKVSFNAVHPKSTQMRQTTIAEIAGLSKSSPRLFRQPVTPVSLLSFLCGANALFPTLRLVPPYSFSSFSVDSVCANKQSKMKAPTFHKRRVMRRGMTPEKVSSSTVSHSSDKLTTTKSITIQIFEKNAFPNATIWSNCSTKKIVSTVTQILWVSLAIVSPCS
mmetsp:Transcript_83173/g.131257  ORF Transcript_83173/g.131257 Transcript_83173/m.131257 type:complete len:333 (-) Transcript_83173:764-1762(-)